MTDKDEASLWGLALRTDATAGWLLAAILFLGLIVFVGISVCESMDKHVYHQAWCAERLRFATDASDTLKVYFIDSYCMETHD